MGKDIRNLTPKTKRKYPLFYPKTYGILAKIVTFWVPPWLKTHFLAPPPKNKRKHSKLGYPPGIPPQKRGVPPKKGVFGILGLVEKRGQNRGWQKRVFSRGVKKGVSKKCVRMRCQFDTFGSDCRKTTCPMRAFKTFTALRFIRTGATLDDKS